MGTQGSIIGGIVGAIIGTIISPGYGTVMGFTIGYGIGSYIDPLEPDTPSPGQPEVGELQISTAEEAIPIPDVLGTTKLGGNILFYGDEHHEAKPKDEYGYNYYCSWGLGICLGPVDELYAVYRNDDLVWEGNETRPASGGSVILELGKVTTIPSSRVFIGSWTTARKRWRFDTIENYAPSGSTKPNKSIIIIYGHTLEKYTINDKTITSFTVTVNSVEYTVSGYSFVEERATKDNFSQTKTTKLALATPCTGNPTYHDMTIDIIWKEVTYEEKGGPYMGHMTFYFGTDDQVAPMLDPNVVEDDTLSPPYRNLCWAYMDDVIIGDYNRVPTMRFIVRRNPTQSWNTYKTVRGRNYNGAHAVYYLFTGSANAPTSLFNTDSFSDVADILAVELRGVSILIRGSANVASYIESVLRHIGGYLVFKANSSGNPQYFLYLARGGEDTSALPIITDTDLLEPPQLERKSWPETYNELRASYSEFVSGSSPGWNYVVSGGDDINGGINVGYSKNGYTWRETEFDSDDPDFEITKRKTITYLPEVGRYIAVGTTGSSNLTVQSSEDGVSWTKRYSEDGGTPKGICAGDSKAIIVSYEDVLISGDGHTFTRYLNKLPKHSAAPYQGICYDVTAGLFVVAAEDIVYTSPDGLIWTERYDSLLGTFNFYDIACDGNNHFVAGGSSGVVLYSTGGINWSAKTVNGTGSTHHGVAAGKDIYIVVGNDPSGKAHIAYSTDFVNWNTVTVSGVLTCTEGETIDDEFHSAFFDGEFFWVVGETAGTPAYPTILRSFDGLNWTFINHKMHNEINPYYWNIIRGVSEL